VVFVLTGILLPEQFPAHSLSYLITIGTVLTSALFGLYFSVRVGGADMPITISLLNSLSGVAGSIAGMAIGDVFLVAVGGIVGASGLLLTQIMCRAMNRSLLSILTGERHRSQSPKPSARQPFYPLTLKKNTYNALWT
jgi:NAD(P) transhydrogenase subunit beta